MSSSFGGYPPVFLIDTNDPNEMERAALNYVMLGQFEKYSKIKKDFLRDKLTDLGRIILKGGIPKPDDLLEIKSSDIGLKFVSVKEGDFEKLINPLVYANSDKKRMYIKYGTNWFLISIDSDKQAIIEDVEEKKTNFKLLDFDWIICEQICKSGECMKLDALEIVQPQPLLETDLFKTPTSSSIPLVEKTVEQLKKNQRSLQNNLERRLKTRDDKFNKYKTTHSKFHKKENREFKEQNTNEHKKLGESFDVKISEMKKSFFSEVSEVSNKLKETIDKRFKEVPKIVQGQLTEPLIKIRNLERSFKVFNVLDMVERVTKIVNEDINTKINEFQTKVQSQLNSVTENLKELVKEGGIGSETMQKQLKLLKNFAISANHGVKKHKDERDLIQNSIINMINKGALKFVKVMIPPPPELGQALSLVEGLDPKSLGNDGKARLTEYFLTQIRTIGKEGKISEDDKPRIETMIKKFSIGSKEMTDELKKLKSPFSDEQKRVALKTVIIERPNPVIIFKENLKSWDKSRISLTGEDAKVVNEHTKTTKTIHRGFDVKILKNGITQAKSKSLSMAQKILDIRLKLVNEVMDLRDLYKIEGTGPKSIKKVFDKIKNIGPPFHKNDRSITMDKTKPKLNYDNKIFDGVAVLNRSEYARYIWTEIIAKKLNKYFSDPANNKTEKIGKTTVKNNEHTFMLFGRTGSGKTSFWELFAKDVAKQIPESIFAKTYGANVKEITTIGYYLTKKRPKTSKTEIVKFRVKHKGGIDDNSYNKKYKPDHEQHKKLFNGDEMKKKTNLFGEESTDLTQTLYLQSVLLDNRMEIIRKSKGHFSTRNHIEKKIVFDDGKGNTASISFFILAGNEKPDTKVFDSNFFNATQSEYIALFRQSNNDFNLDNNDSVIGRMMKYAVDDKVKLRNDLFANSTVIFTCFPTGDKAGVSKGGYDIDTKILLNLMKQLIDKEKKLELFKVNAYLMHQIMAGIGIELSMKVEEKKEKKEPKREDYDGNRWRLNDQSDIIGQSVLDQITTSNIKYEHARVDDMFSSFKNNHVNYV